MAMNRFAVHIEDHTGKEHGPFRVTYRHRAQAEKTCKARGIDPAGGEAELLLAWLVARDQDGTEFEDLSKDDFEDAIFDFTVQRLDPADESDDLDPTNPAP